MILLLLLLGLGFLIWKGWTPKGGWNDDQGKGWWGRWKPRIEPPQGPGPLPKSWDPPDYLPDWLVEEVGPVWIKPSSSVDAPVRPHTTDSPELTDP